MARPWQSGRGDAPAGATYAGAMGVPWWQKLAGRTHATVFRATGGRLGGRLAGIEQVLVTTTGRRSGQPRTTPLAATRDGATLLLVASNGGAPSHPAWYLNLSEHPQIRVEARGATMTMTARTALGPERERAWGLVVAANPGYARYATKAERQIPVVVCEPGPTDGA